MTRVVPIIGQAAPGNFVTAAFWNANVQALGNHVLNVPRFSGYLAANGTVNIASNAGVFTSVIIDTEVEDTDNGHNTTTNSQRYTAQVPGLYLVTGSVCFDKTNATGFRAAKFQVNGTTDVPGSEQVGYPTSTALPFTVAPTPSYVRLNVGDYVLMQACQNSGASIPLVVQGGSQTVFAVQWVAE